MPSRRCGSVSVRLSVWRSREARPGRRRARRRGRRGRRDRGRPAPPRRAPGGSTPGAGSRPRSGSACRPGSRSAASPTRPGGRAPAGRQWSRPAIIRWITTKRSSVQRQDDALAEAPESHDRPALHLRRAADRPSGARRDSPGESARAACRATRGSRAVRYATTSGSSGTGSALTGSARTARRTSSGSGRTWKFRLTENQRTTPSLSSTTVAGRGTSCPSGPPRACTRP